MAEKKYFWLKLQDDFFDEDTISYIEEQENGVYYVNFYLKLCLKSVKTQGRLIRLVGETLIAYNAKSLAKLTNTPTDIVEEALELFEKIGLIAVSENGEIILKQIDELIGSETEKAKDMRQKRAAEKALKSCCTSEEQSGNNVTVSEEQSGNNVTQRLEIRDKRLEIDKNISECVSVKEDDEEEAREAKPAVQVKWRCAVDGATITSCNDFAAEVIPRYFGRAPTEKDRERIIDKCRTLGGEEYNGVTISRWSEEKADLLRYALNAAYIANKIDWRYIDGIWDNFIRRGIRTAAEAQKYEWTRKLE